ncbi:MAG: hypothetical protein HY327_05845 [Chloroflexi bacterium]|nr:hypothetical protein [Chloroflexota bacterium]
MASVSLRLSVEQLIEAIRQLPFEERIKIRKVIDENSREEIERRFDEALRASRAANLEIDEDVLMEEINQAVHEVRAERLAKTSR